MGSELIHKSHFNWNGLMRHVKRPETVVVLAILLGALVLRLLTWERYLPVIDYVDEPNMYLLTRSWRGIEQVAVIPQWLAGYPPLYMWISGLVQPLMEWGVGRPWVYAGEYIGAMRFLAVWVGVLTTWLLYLLGKRTGGALLVRLLQVSGPCHQLLWPVIVWQCLIRSFTSQWHSRCGAPLRAGR